MMPVVRGTRYLDNHIPPRWELSAEKQGEKKPRFRGVSS